MVGWVGGERKNSPVKNSSGQKEKIINGNNFTKNIFVSTKEALLNKVVSARSYVGSACVFEGCRAGFLTLFDEMTFFEEGIDK